MNIWVYILASIVLFVIGIVYIKIVANKSKPLFSLSGYYMFKTEPNIFTIAEGTFSATATHLAFKCRYKHPGGIIKTEISNVRAFEVFDYDVSEHLFEQNEEHDVRIHKKAGSIIGLEDLEIIGCIIVIILVILGAIVLLIGKVTKKPIENKPMDDSILKMSKNELVCRITCNDGEVSFFYYKNSHKNSAIISDIQEHISRTNFIFS